VTGSHDHAPEEACPPTCPGWAEGALRLLALQRRYPEMLAACRAAARIESIVVAPSVPGVVLPEHLKEEELVRLNLVVGRDTPEVLLDEWGIRAGLTFSRRRVDCAFPWASVLAGQLAPPPPPRPRFAVIAGGKKD
jgi:hypothetical protein